jgi:pentatricopeptide repeat protein
MIYTILLNGMCSNNQFTSARELFYRLPKMGLQPNLQTYSVMIKVLCKGGQTDEVCELFEKMDENGCSPNVHTYYTIIKGLLQNDEISNAVELLQIFRAVKLDSKLAPSKWASKNLKGQACQEICMLLQTIIKENQ